MAKRPTKSRTLARLLGEHPPSWVARRLGLKTSTVRRWQREGTSARGARALAELDARRAKPRRRPRPKPAPAPAPKPRRPAPSKRPKPKRPAPPPAPRPRPKRPAPPKPKKPPRRPPRERLTEEEQAAAYGVPVAVLRVAREFARKARRALRTDDFDRARERIELERLREIDRARRRGGELPISADVPRLRGPVEGDDLTKAMVDFHDCVTQKNYAASFWSPASPREDVKEASVTVQVPTEGAGSHSDLANQTLDDAYDCMTKWLTIIPGTNTQLAIVPRFEGGTAGEFAETYRKRNRKGTRSRTPGVREIENMQRRLHLLPNGMIGYERRREGLIVPLREFFEDVKEAIKNVLFESDGSPKPGRRIKNIRFHLVRYRATTRRPNVE